MGRRRRFWVWSVVLLLGLGSALAGLAYVHRAELRAQWQCYLVGKAPSAAEAGRQIAWFDSQDAALRRRVLVEKWGTGNVRFDYYLAAHVSAPGSTDALRAAFSQQLSLRPELLARWAHWWAFRQRGQPGELAALVRFGDELVRAVPPRPVTWRDVLDWQAVFFWSGHPELAEGLSPENWHHRYVRWQALRPAQLPEPPAPESPLPDWPGPPPNE